MMPLEKEDVVAPRAGRREWIGLAVLALACVLYAMDLTVLHLAVPSLSADLEPRSAQLLRITDIYGFLVAGSVITMGTLGDRIGRRRLLLIGAGAFGVASALAAFSTSAEMPISARALLGGHPGAVDPVLDQQHVPGPAPAHGRHRGVDHQLLGRRRDRAVAGRGDAGVLLVGIGVPAGDAGDGATPRAGTGAVARVPGSPVEPVGPEKRRPIPRGVLAVIYGLKQIAQDGLGLLPAVSILAGLALGVAFVRRQRALADPLIDLRLFRLPAFSGSLATFTLAIFAMFGTFLFIAQYLQRVLGLSPLEAGLWTLPQSGGFIVGSMLAPLIVRRIRPAFVMGAGLGLGAVGLALLTQIDAADGLAVLVTSSVVMSLGLGPVSPWVRT